MCRKNIMTMKLPSTDHPVHNQTIHQFSFLSSPVEVASQPDNSTKVMIVAPGETKRTNLLIRGFKAMDNQ